MLSDDKFFTLNLRKKIVYFFWLVKTLLCGLDKPIPYELQIYIIIYFNLLYLNNLCSISWNTENVTNPEKIILSPGRGLRRSPPVKKMLPYCGNIIKTADKIIVKIVLYECHSILKNFTFDNNNMDCMDFSYSKISKCVLGDEKNNMNICDGHFATGLTEWCTFTNVIFKNCNFCKEYKFTDCEFINVNFETCFMFEVHLIKCNFIGCVLGRCVVDRINFEDCECKNSFISDVKNQCMY